MSTTALAPSYSVFFDSWGAPHVDLGWRTADPRAVAFGPNGCSRPAFAADLSAAKLTVRDGETAYTAARRAGRVRDLGDWAVLAAARPSRKTPAARRELRRQRRQVVAS